MGVSWCLRTAGTSCGEFPITDEVVHHDGMRKLFHFDSPREQYHCDASVVGCFDNRFEAATRKLLKRIGVMHPDPIRIAGGAKSLAGPRIPHAGASPNRHQCRRFDRRIEAIHQGCKSKTKVKTTIRDGEISQCCRDLLPNICAPSEPSV